MAAADRGTARLRSRWPRDVERRTDVRLTACHIAVLALAAVSCGTGVAASAASDWRVLSDAKLGGQVEYPADVFSVSEQPREKVGGLRFRTPDGRAELSFFALPTSSGTSPADFLAGHLRLPERAVQYRRTTPSFFAVSGASTGVIYYARCNSSADHSMFHCIYMTYPADEKRAWDAIVTRISRSLHS